MTRLAALGGTGAAARKFLYPPDVVFASGTQTYDAVLIGSGDREHPHDTSVANRFYMLKDTSTDAHRRRSVHRRVEPLRRQRQPDPGRHDARNRAQQEPR